MALAEIKSIQIAGPLETIRNEYDPAIRDAWTHVQESGETHTTEGELVAVYLLSAASILRKRIADTDSLLRDGLLQNTGGEAYNPHRAIDAINGELVDRILAQSDLTTVLLHIEERDQWERVKWQDNSEQAIPPHARVIMVDPIDGTSELLIGEACQTTGIVIYDGQGNFLAGGVISLTDDRVLLVEATQTEQTPEKTIVYRASQEYVMPKTKEVDVAKLRVGTIIRRMPELSQTPLFQKRLEPEHPNLGGSAVLRLISGEVDTLIDPYKGQPWYEAAVWGTLAQACKPYGIIVTGPTGEPIDFWEIIKANILEGKADRIPMVTSTSQAIHDAVLGNI